MNEIYLTIFEAPFLCALFSICGICLNNKVAILGPVGLLVGAASVGIGAGIMQIPEEQRSKLQDRTTRACSSLGSGCGTVTEKIPDQLLTMCGDVRDTGGCAEDSSQGEKSNNRGRDGDSFTKSGNADHDLRHQNNGSRPPQTVHGGSMYTPEKQNKLDHEEDGNDGSRMRRKVACLRKGECVTFDC